MTTQRGSEAASDDLPYGNFKACSTCKAELPEWCEDRSDPEHLLHHGYCSRKCASEAGYHNFQT